MLETDPIKVNRYQRIFYHFVRKAGKKALYEVAVVSTKWVMRDAKAKSLVRNPFVASAIASATKICSIEGCDKNIAAMTTITYLLRRASENVAFLDGIKDQIGELEVHDAVKRYVDEALEAYMRAPASLYARVALDAEVLAHLGIVNLLYSCSNDLAAMLNKLTLSLTYAAAADYVLYTAAARKLATKLKPHTLAAAKWFAEELYEHEFHIVPRLEQTPAGIIGYMDVVACPCGRAVKDITMKPRQNHVAYIIEISCGKCSEFKYEIIVPESTRLK